MSQTMPLLRLKAQHLGNGKVQFQAEFAAPSEQTAGVCASAYLEPGDDTRINVGFLCTPTSVTWREQRTIPLVEHAYTGEGPFTARLIWSDHVITTEVNFAATEEGTSPSLPELTHFTATRNNEDRMQIDVHLAVRGLTPDVRLRVDGGAGQVYWLSGDGTSEQEAAWTLYYTKTGTYNIAVDVVDSDGFWLGTLAEDTITIGLPEEEEGEEEPAATTAPTLSATARIAMEEITILRSGFPAWMPFRYARPVWAYTRTYVSPGGGRVSRILAPGTYISIHEETVVGEHLWYRTGGNDWIPSSSVVLLHPSDLKGVELTGTAPPPPPPSPPSTPTRRGVVTAYILNVRARPGVRPDNPPIDRLRQGTEVLIYEETLYNGETWYRIGVNRWVHGGWVRIVAGQPPASGDVRRGVVTAYILNVRARPGVRPDNPPIDRLRQGTEVLIYEETLYNGETWYRIGVNRWVHGGWVRIVSPRAHATTATETPTSTEGMALPVGWIVASTLNVRARPGVSDDNPPIDRVHYKDRFHILEERVVQGAKWYRIGENRWVYGGWVGVARYKPRPAQIKASDKWVGVSLREQTLVAYEGDTPVYATLVATGVPQYPTVRGIFRTWLRRRWGRMVGGTPGTMHYYYLEDVTWTMYFYRGYSLHTAYWHDAFGRPRSHGCVNLSPYDAWWIFRWSETEDGHSPVVYVYW